ncbi:hypothetical protein ES702_01125 [subsurface metagenome]
MHRIYRPWAAGRESPRLAPASSLYPLVSFFLHRYVSVQRPSFSVCPRGLALVSIRAFTITCNTGLSNQGAQPRRDEDDETDHTTHQYTSHTIASFSERKSATAQQHTAFDDAIFKNDSRGRNPSNNTPLDLRDLPVTEDDFATFSGFWPSHSSDPSLTTPSLRSPLTEPARNEQLGDRALTIEPPGSVIAKLWKVPIRHGKIDLSHWDPIRGERQGTYAEQPKQGPYSRPLGFHAGNARTRTRTLVDDFVRLIYPHVSPTVGLNDDILSTLPTFTPDGMDADLILHIFSWSWIVVAPQPLRIKRLIHWSRSEHGQVTPEVPQWLALQLLRSTHIGPEDLVDLLSLVEQKSPQWDMKRSIMILPLRLLRHARLSHPMSLSRIVELFTRLLDQFFPDQPSLEESRFCAHWCNRLLTLLALPVRAHPFKHVIVQQDAQLLLLHYMHDASPTIPLNREGYRALARLQLMHAKTDSERMWAEVQAHTWPPWEKQHQMGVTSPTRTAPGSASRTNLVLQRMREDGYKPHAFDIAVQILGGRDSDRSPTAQVRRPPTELPSRTLWLPGLDNSHFAQSTQVWVARVTATRTVREAWMAFCAYENAVTEIENAVPVYRAMFAKLWAFTLPARSDIGPLPGDGLENFADPDLARDRVHVPEEPPSVEGLYNRMTARGIMPYGLLLSDLLLWETDLHRGLAYIKDSPMKPHNKEILANPTAHSPKEIATVLNKLHFGTSEAYIGLLTRPHSPRSKAMVEFHGDVSDKCVSGPVFALQVIQHTKQLAREFSLWSTYLAALSRHGLPSEEDQWRISMRLAWKLVCDSYTCEWRQFDASVLPHVLLIARSIQTWAGWSAEDRQHEPLDIGMKFFMEAISGVRNTWTLNGCKKWARLLGRKSPILHSVPTADDVQDMAFLMVAAQQGSMVQDMMNLLHWACRHQQQIAAISTFTKRNLAAFRVYLEGQWATLDPQFMDSGLEIMMATPDEIEQAKEICQQLGGWASDEDVGKYLASSHHLFARLKHKLKSDAQKV